MFAHQWKSFLRYHLVPEQFPRDMYLTRAKVHSESQYINELQSNYLTGNCFLSLYTDAQIEHGIVDCIFLEIDAHAIDEAIKNCAYVQKLLDQMNCSYRLFFSGRRGFHIYLEFAPVQLKNPRMSIRKFVERLPTFLDPHVVGNLQQLVRIVCTVHKQTKLFTFEIPRELDVGLFTEEEIFNWAVKPPEVGMDNAKHIDEETAHTLKEIDEHLHIAPSIEAIYEHMSKKILDEDPFPPCVITALSKLAEKKKASHPERLLVAAFLIKRGYADDEVCNLFAQYAQDYVNRQTMYQIGKIRSGQMNCYCCKSLMRRGLCPYEKKEANRCPWHPSINRLL